MFKGAHFLFFSSQPDADRAFIRDVLGFPTVDAGEGWLIFALPPAELAVHPADSNLIHPQADQDFMNSVLYLMCEDLHATLKSLEARNVAHADISEASWGIKTAVRLPSGGEIGLYQPSHLTAI
jgi:hypothetical protein